MRFCENCGAKLDDDEMFCGECGAKVDLIDVNTPKNSNRKLQNNQKNIKNKQSNQNGEKKKKSPKDIAFIVFIVVLVIGIVAAVFYFLVIKDKSNVNDNSQANTTANATNNTTADTTNNTAPVTTTQNTNEYILPDSDKRVITTEELSKLTPEQVRLACNELYARHGRKFQDSGIQEYFNKMSWYRGTIEPDAFDESVFNSYEKQNKDIIVAYEKGIGTSQQTSNVNTNGYSNQQLIDMARKYINSKGSNPQGIEIESESGDMVTIWLYSDNGISSVTVDRYTVNRKTGEGTNNKGEKIKL